MLNAHTCTPIICIIAGVVFYHPCPLYAVIEIVLNVLNQVGGWVPNLYICTTETDLMYIIHVWERHCMYCTKEHAFLSCIIVIAITTLIGFQW